MVRRKDKDIDYPDKSHVQLKSSSGYCMTKDHGGCKYQFNHGKCGCDCHLQPSSDKITQKAIASDSNEDPRPWRKNE